jgi:hypothetical protein
LPPNSRGRPDTGRADPEPTGPGKIHTLGYPQQNQRTNPKSTRKKTESQEKNHLKQLFSEEDVKTEGMEIPL